jgi:hypothetical protein
VAAIEAVADAVDAVAGATTVAAAMLVEVSEATTDVHKQLITPMAAMVDMVVEHKYTATAMVVVAAVVSTFLTVVLLSCHLSSKFHKDRLVNLSVEVSSTHAMPTTRSAVANQRAHLAGYIYTYILIKDYLTYN